MSKPRTPTASGISRLLAAAGHTRAVSKLRGGVSGYSVSKYGAGPAIEVRYSSISMGVSDEYRCSMLIRYVKTIAEAGYAAEPLIGPPRLIVTAKED